jgi:hypothetical protein
VNHGIRGTGQQNVLKDSSYLVIEASACKQVLIGLAFPKAKSWTCPRTTGATLYSVATVIGSEFFLKVKRLVAPLFVVITNDIMRAGNHTTGTSGADTCIDNLGFEFLPLICPAGRGGSYEFLG